MTELAKGLLIWFTGFILFYAVALVIYLCKCFIEWHIFVPTNESLRGLFVISLFIGCVFRVFYWMVKD